MGLFRIAKKIGKALVIATLTTSLVGLFVLAFVSSFFSTTHEDWSVNQIWFAAILFFMFVGVFTIAMLETFDNPVVELYEPVSRKKPKRWSQEYIEELQAHLNENNSKIKKK